VLIKLKALRIGEIMEFKTYADKMDSKKAEQYILRANELFDVGSYKDAFIAYNSALELYNNMRVNTKRAFLHNKLGKCKSALLDYTDALNYFEKSYLYSIEYRDEVTIKNCLYNLALVNKRLGNINEALKRINEFINLINKKDNFNEYISGIIVKANCYVDIKGFDEAIKLYNDVIPMFKDAAHPLLGYVYHNLGLICLEKEELNSILENFNRAITIREISDKINLSHTQIEKAKVFIKFNMYEQAIAMTKDAIDSAKQYNDIRYVLDGYYQLEKIYEDTKKNELLEELYLNIIDILQNTNRKEDILRIHIKLLNLNRNESDKYMKYLEEATHI
jgi:tetratricopeptide (TPR) repeat protein